MALKTESPANTPNRTPEEIDGEIYVRLGKKHLSWRAAMMLALFALTAGGLALSAYSEMASVTNAGKYSKSTTQCPGMTPAQREAAQLTK